MGVSYRAKGGNKKPIGAKTLDGYGKDIGFFITVMGDPHIGEINRDIAGEYCNILRRLPASRTRRDGPAQAASNWFQRFRAHVGIAEKQVAVFHSFRHGFITNVLESGMAPYLVAPIVGHERELITEKVYWNTKDATKRKPTVEAFTLRRGFLLSGKITCQQYGTNRNRGLWLRK
jgi:integrase